MTTSTTKTNSVIKVIADNASAMAAENEAMDWKKVAESYVIDSPEMAEAAAEDLKAIKSKSKEVDELRKKLKKPSLEEGKAIDKHFKKPLEFLTGAEGVLKGAILKYQDEQEAKSLESAETSDDDFALPANTETAAPVKLEGISTRKVWKGEVTDIKALAKAIANGEAPEDLLLPNQSAINELAKAMKGSLKIPGIKTYEEKSLAASRS